MRSNDQEIGVLKLLFELFDRCRKEIVQGQISEPVSVAFLEELHPIVRILEVSGPNSGNEVAPRLDKRESPVGAWHEGSHSARRRRGQHRGSDRRLYLAQVHQRLPQIASHLEAERVAKEKGHPLTLLEDRRNKPVKDLCLPQHPIGRPTLSVNQGEEPILNLLHYRSIPGAAHFDKRENLRILRTSCGTLFK